MSKPKSKSKSKIAIEMPDGTDLTEKNRLRIEIIYNVITNEENETNQLKWLVDLAHITEQQIVNLETFINYHKSAWTTDDINTRKYIEYIEDKFNQHFNIDDARDKIAYTYVRNNIIMDKIKVEDNPFNFKYNKETNQMRCDNNSQNQKHILMMYIIKQHIDYYNKKKISNKLNEDLKSTISQITKCSGYFKNFAAIKKTCLSLPDIKFKPEYNERSYNKYYNKLTNKERDIVKQLTAKDREFRGKIENIAGLTMSGIGAATSSITTSVALLSGASVAAVMSGPLMPLIVTGLIIGVTGFLIVLSINSWQANDTQRIKAANLALENIDKKEADKATPIASTINKNYKAELDKIKTGFFSNLYHGNITCTDEELEKEKQLLLNIISILSELMSSINSLKIDIFKIRTFEIVLNKMCMSELQDTAELMEELSDAKKIRSIGPEQDEKINELKSSFNTDIYNSTIDFFTSKKDKLKLLLYSNAESSTFTKNRVARDIVVMKAFIRKMHALIEYGNVNVAKFDDSTMHRIFESVIINEPYFKNISHEEALNKIIKKNKSQENEADRDMYNKSRERSALKKQQEKKASEIEKKRLEDMRQNVQENLLFKRDDQSLTLDDRVENRFPQHSSVALLRMLLYNLSKSQKIKFDGVTYNKNDVSIDDTNIQNLKDRVNTKLKEPNILDILLKYEKRKRLDKNKKDPEYKAELELISKKIDDNLARTLGTVGLVNTQRILWCLKYYEDTDEANVIYDFGNRTAIIDEAHRPQIISDITQKYNTYPRYKQKVLEYIASIELEKKQFKQSSKTRRKSHGGGRKSHKKHYKKILKNNSTYKVRGRNLRKTKWMH